MTDDYPTIDTTDDAFEVMDDLDGRDVIRADMAERLAEPFGVSLEDTDIVAPTSDHLPYRPDDETPAVGMCDLANTILVENGGEWQGSPLVGTGSSADWEFDAAMNELKQMEWDA